MSARHPIIAVTGLSDVAASPFQRTLEWIFRREKIAAVSVEGAAFRRYDHAGMKRAIRDADGRGDRRFSALGPEANLLEELETLFRRYGESGRGYVRRCLDARAAADAGVEAGTFTPWQDIEGETDLLLYQGLHGGVVTDKVNIARHVDLMIGAMAVANLDWIEALHHEAWLQDCAPDVVAQRMLRRMPDYVEYICPQFTETHINFQRVPIVDTSNPFIARYAPGADETLVVIRFRNPKGIDFPYLLSMLRDSYMSRPNTIVLPGARIELALQLILTPMILKLAETRRRVIGAAGSSSAPGAQAPAARLAP